jgi:transcriptional regulator with XRE-family HTH domain
MDRMPLSTETSVWLKPQARQEVKVANAVQAAAVSADLSYGSGAKSAASLSRRASERAGMSKGNLSNIETGKTGYNQATLEALADGSAVRSGRPARAQSLRPGRHLEPLGNRPRPAQRKQLIGMIDSYLKAAAG